MSKPNVLVGIPTLNNPTCLKRCLDAIAESTSFDTDYNVKVLVCDDCSSPENLAANKTIIHNATARIPGLEMLMNTERRGVSTTWNTLVRHYRDANEIVLLNDDVEVVPDWLDVLVYSVLMNDRAGMIGLNTNVGTTKEQAGPQLRSEYNEATLFDGNGELVSSFGPIFAFRRSDFDAVHGFDEGFFVFYEEIDFGLRLALELGRTNLIASYPRVFHMGGATTSQPSNFNASNELLKSRARFQEKYGGRSFERLRSDIRDAHARAGYSRSRVNQFWTWNTQLKVWRE